MICLAAVAKCEDSFSPCSEQSSRAKYGSKEEEHPKVGMLPDTIFLQKISVVFSCLQYLAISASLRLSET